MYRTSCADCFIAVNSINLRPVSVATLPTPFTAIKQPLPFPLVLLPPPWQQLGNQKFPSQELSIKQFSGVATHQDVLMSCHAHPSQRRGRAPSFPFAGRVPFINHIPTCRSVASSAVHYRPARVCMCVFMGPLVDEI